MLGARIKASWLTLSGFPGSKPTLVAKANFFTTFFGLMVFKCGVFGEVGLCLEAKVAISWFSFW